MSEKYYPQHHCLRKFSFKLEKLLSLPFVLYLSSGELFTPPVYKVDILKLNYHMHFAYVQYIYNHVHLQDVEKCPGNEVFAKDPGSQLWHTVQVRKPCKRCWSASTEMGTNSHISNSCSRLSEESTTSTYFLKRIKIEMMLFSYEMVHEFICKKEAEMWQSESYFLQRYGLEWMPMTKSKSVKSTTVDRSYSKSFTTHTVLFRATHPSR